MRSTNKAFLLFTALAIALGILWFAARDMKEQFGEGLISLITEPVDMGDHLSDATKVAIIESEESVSKEMLVSAVSAPSIEQNSHAPESLKDLLPTWLAEEGSLLHDRRGIMGHSVLRSRGRYEWDQRSLLEIEITNVGVDADDELFKALGFDLELTNVEEEGGYKYFQDEGEYFVNVEYDYEDQSGSLQMIVSERYLVEIQIEQMDEQAFQEILDEQIPFDEIFRRLKL